MGHKIHQIRFVSSVLAVETILYWWLLPSCFFNKCMSIREFLNRRWYCCLYQDTLFLQRQHISTQGGYIIRRGFLLHPFKSYAVVPLLQMPVMLKANWSYFCFLTFKRKHSTRKCNIEACVRLSGSHAPMLSKGLNPHPGWVNCVSEQATYNLPFMNNCRHCPTHLRTIILTCKNDYSGTWGENGVWISLHSYNWVLAVTFLHWEHPCRDSDHLLEQTDD